jgi:hypothetical protein
MLAYDQLPPELRGWMRDAVLPWSARSCLKVWNKARHEGLTATAALERLNAIEHAMLGARYERDAPQGSGAIQAVA